MIRLVVLGQPVTQGSKTAVMVAGRPRVLEGKGEGRQRHKDWRHAVATEARHWQLTAEDPALLEGPIVVRFTFGMQKPASAPKRTRTWPIKARSGDIDKLARSILDSLTGVLFADDSQVVGLVAVKDWSALPGVVVEVRTVEDVPAGELEATWVEWMAGAWHPAPLPADAVGRSVA